ncbi:serine/threonine-protein kinase [Actinacidiphila acidipaludis]|uniref:non-specific serine/threonine protein kinase n=1 Tax=Actinacidiphila acidipaludis TaxID=2873382 RepID=A0ABS7QDX0_9ACTN|nr:serine/threonine-protein kinase [Streptomyces acidipaludis]MBY8881366.1 serine/threonine protein kinase [Streptomyces acidipaludis]
MGEVFAGRYELVDPIGRGGVGAVWRAWDHRRRRYVAAKVLQQSDAHALLRFVREQALRIDHPHVLAPASWAADDAKVLFTMDLVRGGSLSHLIGDYGPLPPRYVCVLLDQLLAGLTAVHAEGVIHRDIKPANILLEATGTGTPHIRLSDFGIAMRMSDARLTEADYVVGTPGYFAPEQMTGAEPDFPADLYAVGLVALYLLSGRKPDAQALVERFETDGMPPAPIGVPEAMWQVIGALLQPDPYARFRTATGARKALAAAVQLLPEPAADDEPVEIFDQIGALPGGFGPDGPLSEEEAGPAEGGPGVPGALPTPHEAGVPGQHAPSPAPARTPAPAPAPGHAQTPGPAHVSAPASAPSEPPPPPPSPAHQRPKGRHAAPLPAHEPLTHTRTRVEPPVPGALPLPGPLPQLQPPSPAGPLPPAAPAAAPVGGPAPTADTASVQVPATRPRPGPPATIVVPVLVLAVLCFAVGFVALALS